MAKAEVDENFEKIQQASANFETVEKQCQEVLLELDQEEVLEPFRREYDTLHSSFIKLHEGERRLIKKCLDLQAEIHTCQTKVKTAEELSAGDHQTIDNLQKEIAKARQRLELSKEKEVTAKETIKRLRMDLKDLEKQVEKGVSGLIGHDSALQELQKVREDLQKERDSQATQLKAINADISRFEHEMNELLKEKEAQDEEIRKLKEVCKRRQDELEEQKQRKEDWELKLKQLKGELQQHHAQIKTNDQIVMAGQLAIQRLDEQLADQKAHTERAIKEYESINKKTQKFQHDLEQEIEKTSSIKAENSHLNAQLKQKEQEIAHQQHEIAKQTKLRDAALKRNRQLEAQRREIEEERNALRGEIQALEQDIASGRKASENDRKQIDDLTRERDILNKNYLKAQGGTQKQKDLLLIKENQRRNLEQEIKGYEKHAHKQRELIYHLQFETEQYNKDAAEALAKYVKALEEVKMLENKVDENQRAIQDSENRKKQQQGLFEQVLNERNLYSKNLLEAHAEIQEMKRRFRIMHHNIVQLKDEIQQKEKELVELNIKKSKLENDKKRFKQKKQKFETMIDANNRKIISLGDEINKLNEIINEADSEKAKQKRDYENVMNERDILGAQLIKRNDELARLYERIRIQQSAMNKGDVQYRDRQMELRQLRERSQQLAEELETVKAFICKIDVLKLEINKSTKELMHERAKVRALTDELRNPLNVHRWHKMEGSDPQTYDALLRIHDLQKQLILKTEEVEEKEKLISEKEKLYVELKTILQRQPGPEVAEQLNVYQDNLRKKNSQMKAMQASLAHFQEQVTRCQAQHDEISADLGRLRKDYFTKRRRDKKEEEKQAAVAEMLQGTGASPTAQRRYDEPYRGHQVEPLDGGAGAPAASPPGAGDTVGSEDPYAFDAKAAAAAAAAAAAPATAPAEDQGAAGGAAPAAPEPAAAEAPPEPGPGPEPAATEGGDAAPAEGAEEPAS
eukprot:TRINITY_DN59996_c0_g1_i1.p2 TRINITY_DN59996_c0_g1~~TRINITY_DN59996_c0_g1_i1.p2  ORF type:complete len:973 (+),score=544.19 TRINITY_DN59996_c0_g1_i1:90-3008(+)